MDKGISVVEFKSSLFKPIEFSDSLCATVFTEEYTEVYALV